MSLSSHVFPHQHECGSSEISKQSLLLDVEGSEQGSSKASASLLFSSPLIPSPLVPPPGYVWYILPDKLISHVLPQISRNTSTKHLNHLYFLSSDYSGKQYDHETSQLCQESTSIILHISQHELLHPIIIYHNNTEGWMGRRSDW